MSRRTTLLLTAVIVAAGLSIPRLNPPAVALAQSQPQATSDDQDQDGVPDSWESNGVSITTLSGKKWLDLKGDKASPTAKDVYVWVDWMNASGHNHRPQEAAIQLVKDAFAAHNIGLHVFYADKYFNKPLKEVDPLGSTSDDEYDWSEFDKRRDERFPKELRGKFHYALFAHLMGGQGTSSGMSRDFGAYDFIVSLAGIEGPKNPAGTTQDQAGTFMHELGHNLGLHHGGGEDDTTYKPNYLSVMNYSFQFQGLIRDQQPGLFDYSSFALDKLNEDSLDPTAGITSDQSLSRWGSYRFCTCTEDATRVDSIFGPIDWSCSQAPATPAKVSRTVRYADRFGMPDQATAGIERRLDSSRFHPPTQAGGRIREPHERGRSRHGCPHSHPARHRPHRRQGCRRHQNRVGGHASRSGDCLSRIPQRSRGATRAPGRHRRDLLYGHHRPRGSRIRVLRPLAHRHHTRERPRVSGSGQAGRLSYLGGP
jgi:hypothetical protein